ncbi:hypothetical protein HKX42_04325 [Salinisphaera sp. USBA-960]|uniref:type IV pilus assembly protein FimV n=1 Tax=Salinisphaera orenii TaxID=856731 RepID=UPI00147499DE|nr:hypothetical protein [Salifodinibacter halophilus]NNC26102.1 hypothetical protein [Salifodinibacter halophilus]
MLMIAGNANALQFGKATVTSSLNEPLQAKFKIDQLTAGQREQLKIRKASLKAYKRFNFKRKSIVGQIALKTNHHKPRSVVVHLRSDKPVTTSGISFLVEAKTKNGRYFHRYDLLLNPSEQNTNGGQVAIADNSATASGEYTTQPDKSQPKQADGQHKHGNYGPVKKDMTLWRIAKKLKPKGTTTPQMALALYRASPKAFDGGINGLEAGTYLKVPDDKKVHAIDAAKAKRKLEGNT